MAQHTVKSYLSSSSRSQEINGRRILFRNQALQRQTPATTAPSKSIQSTRWPFTKRTSTDAQMAIGMPIINPQITKKYCIDSAPRVAAGSPRRRLCQFRNNAKAVNTTSPACSIQNQMASESILQRFMAVASCSILQSKTRARIVDDILAGSFAVCLSNKTTKGRVEARMITPVTKNHVSFQNNGLHHR